MVVGGVGCLDTRMSCTNSSMTAAQAVGRLKSVEVPFTIHGALCVCVVRCLAKKRVLISRLFNLIHSICRCARGLPYGV